jgi:hypothetical protein
MDNWLGTCSSHPIMSDSEQYFFSFFVKNGYCNIYIVVKVLINGVLYMFYTYFGFLV